MNLLVRGTSLSWARGWACVLMLLASVGAQASNSMSPAPPRGADPFVGIVDSKSLAIAPSASIAGADSKRVAVILSNATEKHLKWSEMASHGWGGYNDFWTRGMRGQAFMEHSTRMHQDAYDPKRVVAGAVEPLVRKVGSVEVIGNYSEFLKGDYDLLAVVDITFVNIVPKVGAVFGAKCQWGLYMNVRFVDRSNTIVGVLDSGETRKVRTPPELMDDAIEIRGAVIAAYQAAMDGLLGPDKSDARTAESPPETVATTGAPAIADKLAELDDLLRRGIVTPAEAEAMRKKILGL